MRTPRSPLERSSEPASETGTHRAVTRSDAVRGAVDALREALRLGALCRCAHTANVLCETDRSGYDSHAAGAVIVIAHLTEESPCRRSSPSIPTTTSMTTTSIEPTR